MNFLTDEVWNNSPQHFTPKNLQPKEDATAANLEHLAMPMIHPTTGETISSYKKLINDPATMETWQTAFGKDFGGMAQGDNKTGQKGTNAIFVMTHEEILLIPADRTITYARVVVDFRPQKADPHRIRITAGGNLINYPGELTTQTAAMTLGSGTARVVMTELHGDFLMHSRAIFLTEVSNYYLDILGKAGGTPPHTAEIKATCWALVTKLSRVLFKEVHGVRMHAAGLEHVVGDPARVNGLYLYAALEEFLRVLREFAAHDYRQHPKYNHFVTMHLFDTTLPRSVWEKRTDGAGRDMLRLTRLESVLTDQGAHIDRMKTGLGLVRQSLGLPAPAARNRRRAGAGGKGVTMGDGVETIE
jgi:hypothetical protein